MVKDGNKNNHYRQNNKDNQKQTGRIIYEITGKCEKDCWIYVTENTRIATSK